MARSLQEAVLESYDAHRDAVWGACYRLTGTVQDADEVTQETYLRLTEKPPERLDDSLRNWLLTVAVNLCRDRLRRRKKTSFVGQWLPAPSAFDETSGWFADEGRSLLAHSQEQESPAQESPEQQLERLESASYAFLLALEELTPNQRSVFLLRDVYDFSVRETADALGLSTSNVKTTCHRARKRLEKAETRPPGKDLREATRAALETFLECVVTRDFERLEQLFRDDVRLLSDGGDGEYSAATRPLVGQASVIAFLRGISDQPGEISVDAVTLNGLPALVVRATPTSPRQAPTIVVRVELDEAQQVREIHLVMASDKLEALTPQL